MRVDRAEWVGRFPCRGQEAPQRALIGSVNESGKRVKIARPEIVTPSFLSLMADGGSYEYAPSRR
jgi:hypothetical protein